MEQTIFYSMQPCDLRLIIKECIEECIQKTKEKNKTSQDEYISKKEAAKMLTMSLPTLDDRCKEGILVRYKIGRKVIFKVKDIEAYLLKQCIK
jgi:excisionase family DNA binding protein